MTRTLRNLRATENEPRGMLTEVREKPNATPEDILAVDNRLTEIRGQIEQVQGRKNMLENLIGLSTIEVTLAPRRVAAGCGNRLAARSRVPQRLTFAGQWPANAGHSAHLVCGGRGARAPADCSALCTLLLHCARGWCAAAAADRQRHNGSRRTAANRAERHGDMLLRAALLLFVAITVI